MIIMRIQNYLKQKKKTSKEFLYINRIQFFFTTENPILYIEKLFNAIKNKSNSLKRRRKFKDIDKKYKNINCILDDVNNIIQNNLCFQKCKDIENMKHNLNDFCNIWLGRTFLNCSILKKQYSNNNKNKFISLYDQKKYIKYYNYDFENKKNIIKQCVLLENTKVMKTFLGIVNKCTIIQIFIFDTSITNSFEINEFFQLQNLSVFFFSLTITEL